MSLREKMANILCKSKLYNNKLYFASFVFGFLSCWFVFSTNKLSGFYSVFLQKATHKYIAITTILLFMIILSSVIIGVIRFLYKQDKRKIIITSAKIVFLLLAIYSVLIYLLIKNVTDWKAFTIHELNYLLYIFAWYSLIKAFKVWRKYGNFYEKLLKGDVKKYLLCAIFILTIVNALLFYFNRLIFTEAFGILSLSMLVLCVISLLITTVALKNKSIVNQIIEEQKETNARIKNKETPKEVSLLYDQMTIITLLSVISKRVLDVSKSTDFQFIFSKVFKIVCYSISLITTCIFTKQIKKIKKSLYVFYPILIAIICCAYSSGFHSILLSNKVMHDYLCFFIDYVCLPIGTIKIIIQITTLLVAKKTTGLSLNYFLMGSFFSLITALNLISKEYFYDNTITMSLYKSLLFLTMAIFMVLIDVYYSQKVLKKSS